MNLHLIIVGAAAPRLDLGPVPMRWNNPLQADIREVLRFAAEMRAARDAKVKVTFIDPAYPGVEEIDHGQCDEDDIVLGSYSWCREAFDLKNAQLHLKEGWTNVVVEFYNPLDENWAMYGMDAAPTYLTEYKDRSLQTRLVILACGCMWDRGFPTECIRRCLEDKITTPLNSFNWGMFEILLQTDKEECMVPYFRGAMGVMGSLMCRGMSNDFSTEEVVRDFARSGSISAFMVDNDMGAELMQFADGTKHWNFLSRALRETVARAVYGECGVASS
jgi:hypothetical protein